DQRREPERARHQHRLVVGFVAVLAQRVHVGDGGVEFLLRELHLAHEIVQVPHERRHDLAKARIARALQLREHGLGDVLLILDDHASPRSMEHVPVRLIHTSQYSLGALPLHHSASKTRVNALMLGEGWGGGWKLLRSVRQTTTPTPNPSPQGGGEQSLCVPRLCVNLSGTRTRGFEAEYEEVTP